MTNTKKPRMAYAVTVATFAEGASYPESCDELIARFAAKGDAVIFADARAMLPMPHGKYLRFCVEIPARSIRNRLVSVHG